MRNRRAMLGGRSFWLEGCGIRPSGPAVYEVDKKAVFRENRLRYRMVRIVLIGSDLACCAEYLSEVRRKLRIILRHLGRNKRMTTRRIIAPLGARAPARAGPW